MLDYHVHSQFSADSKMPMDIACEAALERGITEIAFTDHIDYFFPNPSITFQFDYDEYADSVDRVRKQFDGRLTILKAVEIGLHHSVLEKSRRFVTENEFDFIIGSVHVADNLDLHNGDYFRDKTVDQAVEGYFETVYHAVREHPYFHVLGHLDLVKRYTHHLQADPDEINWGRYMDIIEATLKHLIETGRGIEINMSGYRYKLNVSLPGERVLRLYHELGGEVITVGSDAHHQAHIAHHFDEAYRMLDSLGFRYVTAYRAGKPRFIPLDDL